MPVLLHFLVIDDNADSRSLLVRTLLRRYPGAAVQERQESETAAALAENDRLTAIVAHRTFDDDGANLVRRLRTVSPTVPIVMVSGSDRANEAAAAGATRFLNYDEWLRIGSVVQELFAQTRSPFGSAGSSEESLAPQPA